MEASARPADRRPAALMAAAIVVSAAVAFYYYNKGKGPETVAVEGFDVGEVAARPAPKTSLEFERPQSSPAPLIGEGFVPPAPAPARAQSGEPGKEAARSVEELRAQAKSAKPLSEKDFLKTHGATLKQYQAHMGRITQRYYRTHPVVREVDRAFAKMPRYMEVVGRYQKHGDPFQFSREAIALPEVRAEIGARLSDPRAWRAALGMIVDTLKQPPPAEVFNAAERFIKHDPAMKSYMPEFMMGVVPNMPLAMKAMPKDADAEALGALAGDLAPGGGKAPAAAQAKPRR